MESPKVKGWHEKRSSPSALGSNIVCSEEANLNHCFSCYHCFLQPLFLVTIVSLVFSCKPSSARGVAVLKTWKCYGGRRIIIFLKNSIFIHLELSKTIRCFLLPVKSEDTNRGDKSGEKKSFLLASLNAAAEADR